MPLRLATSADLVPASSILAAAFHDEPLHGPIMHPHRQQFPKDMSLFFLGKLRTALYSGPDHVVVIAHDAATPETIAGVAYWKRLNGRASTPLFYQVTRKCAQMYNIVEGLVFPNRAADPAQADILDRTGPYVAHHWTGSRAQVWDLVLLGVDPSFGRKGFGKALVEWGFARAKAEGVGCSVTSSQGNDKFYERCGFDVCVGRAGDEGGEANPTRHVAGGTIHFWDNGRSLDGVKKYGQV